MMVEDQKKLVPYSSSCASGLGNNSYHSLFTNSADAMLIVEHGMISDCNRAAVEMLRYKDKAALLQTHPSKLSPEYQPDGLSSFNKANKMIQVALSNGNHRFEWNHLSADGEVFPLEVLLTAIPSDSGHCLHVVWRDISERKRLETELRHSQKLEIVGKMVGGITHSINNQLVPILGYCEMMSSMLASEHPAMLDLLEEINCAGNRAAALVKQLLLFSRKEEHQEITIDLNKVMRSLVSMLGQLIGEDIQLNFVPSKQSLLVRVDPLDLEQIVLNLAANARDACPEGGEILLKLSLEKKRSGNYAQLEFADKGLGMDAETLAQIFVPFFTTKEAGAGTGLGMSSTYGLVTKASGKITVKSVLGKGSCFKILFPIVTGPATKIGSGRPTLVDKPVFAEFSQERHILVVEDDEQVKRLVMRTLNAQKFQVSVASDGLEALECLKDQKIDMVLSDMVMSKMNGTRLVKEMKSRSIEIPVVFMSGYTDERLNALTFKMKDIPLLRKPFTPSQLLNEVSKAFSAVV